MIVVFTFVSRSKTQNKIEQVSRFSSGHITAKHKTHQNGSKLKTYHNTILARQAVCFSSELNHTSPSGGGVPQRFTWQKALFTVHKDSWSINGA